MTTRLVDILPLQREKGVYFQADVERPGRFEIHYYRLRLQEGRVYPDEVVASLPQIGHQHAFADEWRARRASTDLLMSHLIKHKPNAVLEIGCGNGWLSNQLATLRCQVIGIDCNEAELLQAARVFSKDNLVFVYGDIFDCPFQPQSFDTIVLASSLQYFSDFKKLIDRLLQLLSDNGEIHIIDTPIYKDERASGEAAHRSHHYFKSRKMEEMAKQYFHHTRNEFTAFQSDVMFDPKSTGAVIQSRLFGRSLPVFPWFRIRKKQ